MFPLPRSSWFFNYVSRLICHSFWNPWPEKPSQQPSLRVKWAAAGAKKNGQQKKGPGTVITWREGLVMVELFWSGVHCDGGCLRPLLVCVYICGFALSLSLTLLHAHSLSQSHTDTLSLSLSLSLTHTHTPIYVCVRTYIFVYSC